MSMGPGGRPGGKACSKAGGSDSTVRKLGSPYEQSREHQCSELSRRLQVGCHENNRVCSMCLASSSPPRSPDAAPECGWAVALLPGPGGSLRTEAEGPTPRRSCPPGGASCAWRWPRPPPACTAASPSPTPSAGPRPGARAAGPPAAGPGPVRGTGEGHIRQGLRGSAGMGGTPQPCLSSPPAPQQTEPKCLLVWGSGMQPSPVGRPPGRHVNS